MDHEQTRSSSKQSEEWFEKFKSGRMKFSFNGELNSTQEMSNIFHTSQVSSGEPDFVSSVIEENEGRYSNLMHSASVNTFVNNGTDFVRNFCGNSKFTHANNLQSSCVVTKQELVETSHSVSEDLLQNFNAFPQFCSFSGFPKFKPIVPPFNDDDLQIKENWSSNRNKIQMSRSTIEYPTSMKFYRYSSEQVFHTIEEMGFSQMSEAYCVSESESDDDDDGPHLFSSDGLSDRRLSIESSEICSVTTVGEESGQPLAVEGTPDFRKEKSYRIANELLTTERNYVQVLYIIDQVFHFRVDNENRAHFMFPQEMVSTMFSNIKSIYKFHHEFLLPVLEARMADWEKEKRIGDIMKTFAPFLKLYTEYVKNFDKAMDTVNTLAAKNPRFSSIMEEIHVMPECQGLSLTHHMLSPVQRVPRYELLLKEYLKRLTEDSPDREDTEKALHLVSTAANHSNEAMKKIDKFKQLLEIQDKISGVVDLVSPTRELLKEGKIVKISARSGDIQERYLFLFNDILLICSSRLIPNLVITGPIYRLRLKFDIEAIQVLEGDNLMITNSFYIRENLKKVELYTQTPEEKASWIDNIVRAAEELNRKKASLKIGMDSSCILESDIGRREPNLLRMDSVTKCMDCGSNFSVMKRKRHCHACGLVFCNKCSNHKLPLPYDDDKPSRVCDRCFQIVSKRKSGSSPDKSPEGREDGNGYVNLILSTGKGLLEVSAGANCVLNGYLQLKTNKSWDRRWFALHCDFVLYSFRSSTEERALTATPIPGFTVGKVTDQKGESFTDKDKVFKLFHTKKIYYFQAASKDEVDKWVSALQKAAQAEIPSPITDCVNDAM